MFRVPVSMLVGVVALLVAPLARAADEPLPWTKGIQLLVNISNIAGDVGDALEFEDRTAVGGGLFATIPLSTSFAIKTALNYAPRGAKTSSSGSSGGTNATVELNYLEAPVLARFTLSQKGKVRPVLFAGPEISVIISSTIEVSGTGSGSYDLLAEDFDFGLCAGGGLEIGAGKGTVLVDARYTWGLTDVYNAVDLSDDTNRTLTLSLGYGF